MAPLDIDHRQFTESLLEQIRRKDAVIGVVGLGVVGFTTFRLCESGGFTVIGYDINAEVVNERAKLFRGEARCTFGSDPSILEGADVVFIAIRFSAATIDREQDQAFDSFTRIFSSLSRAPRLVILESTIKPGATRELAKRLSAALGNEAPLVAFCSERLRVDEEISSVRQVPRVVGGITDGAAEAACLVLEQIGIQPIRAGCPEVAELSKLLENAFLTTGICLMGEITKIAHKLGINASDVADAAASKPHGYFPFWPGPGIGGHCLPNDLALLRKTAKDLGLAAPLLDGVEAVSSGLNATVLKRLEALLQSRGTALKGARIWLIGVGFKVGTADTSNAAAFGVVRLLRAQGATALYSDARIAGLDVDGGAVERIQPGHWPADVDAALILTGDPTINLEELADRVPLVLDTGGAKAMDGDRSRIHPI